MLSMKIKGKGVHFGYLYWFICTYGWTFRKGLAEMGEDAGGLTYDPIRHQLRTLESMGYLTIDKKHTPFTISINKQRVLREMGIENERV